MLRQTVLSVVFVVGTSAFGQEIRWQPVSASGTGLVFDIVDHAALEGTPTEIRLNLSGNDVVVTLELHLSGWGSAPGTPDLISYQGTIDSTGYDNGLGAALNPFGWPTPDPELGAFIDTQHLDFVFPEQPLQAVAVVTLDYEWGAMSMSGPTVDDGGIYYGGTLIIEIPEGSRGTFTIDWNPSDAKTFLVDSDAQLIPGLVKTSALITVLDCNENDVPDGRDIAEGTSEDCNDNSVPDECDVAEGTSPDINGGGIPDECEIVPPVAAPPEHDVRKNRYVSFSPGNEGFSTALHIELIASGVYPESIGRAGWLTEPTAEHVSRIVAEPYFNTAWPDVVHVGDCEIAPAATYALRVSVNGTGFTDSLELDTITRPLPKSWADVVGSFGIQGWSAPDGIVNMSDIQAVLQCFTGSPSAPHRTWVDLDGEVPNMILNMTDVQQAVSGFKGLPYPFSAPADCP